MRRLLIALLLLSGCAHAPVLPAPHGLPRIRDLSQTHHYSLPPVSHVIVIIQENRTMDNLFNGYPGADTQNYGYTLDGMRVSLKPVPLYQP